MAPHAGRGVCVAVAVVCSMAAAAWAQDLKFSAQVDKTAADVGEPVTLTLTLAGDTADATLRPLNLPEGLVIAAQSQQSNFTIHAGAMERAVSLVYVLVPQKAGTFTLGPFIVEHRKKEFQTAPVEVTVKKSALPPTLKPQGERFTL